MPRKAGQITLMTLVSPEFHEEIVDFCQRYKVSQRLLIRELLGWAVKQDAIELVRAGVRLPLWPEDFEKPPQPE